MILHFEPAVWNVGLVCIAGAFPYLSSHTRAHRDYQGPCSINNIVGGSLAAGVDS